MRQLDDTNSSASPVAGPRQTVQHSIRRRLGGRRSLVIGGGAVVAAGLASAWSWLGAIGVAPILISLAPCLVMCALGMCMQRMTSGSGSSEAQTEADARPNVSGGRSAIAPSESSKIGLPAGKEFA